MHKVSDFFTAFAAFTASGSATGHGEFFAPTFMAANADGVRVLTPDQLGIGATRMRAVLDPLGRRTTTLVKADEQDLDANYVMSTTEWHWRFEPERGDAFEVSLTATHILHRTADGLRIVFYRTGDILQALRSRGLLA